MGEMASVKTALVTQQASHDPRPERRTGKLPVADSGPVRPVGHKRGSFRFLAFSEASRVAGNRPVLRTAPSGRTWADRATLGCMAAKKRRSRRSSRRSRSHRHGNSATGMAEKLIAMGARTHAMFPEAVAATRETSPAQFFFFAMSSRRDDARVVEASIGKDPMARAARKIGGVVKGGYVVDGVAYILPKV